MQLVCWLGAWEENIAREVLDSRWRDDALQQLSDVVTLETYWKRLVGYAISDDCYDSAVMADGEYAEFRTNVNKGRELARKHIDPDQYVVFSFFASD